MFASASVRPSFTTVLSALLALFIAGCASVPMGSKEKDTQAKSFAAPAEGKAGLYIYRNTFVGQALTRSLSIDGQAIGKTANKVYFYKEVAPGVHTVATESEFSDNSIQVTVEAGKHYFIRQYIKMGVFVGGANVELVSDDVGKKEVLECSLAQSP